MDLSAKPISKNNFYRNVAQIRVLYLVSVEKEKGKGRRKVNTVILQAYGLYY